MHKAWLFAIVILTSLGLLRQVYANHKRGQAPFLSMPMALFLLFPYPCWAIYAAHVKDTALLLTMLLLGAPSIWLSITVQRPVPF